ncbi:MAG: radical SAM protein [Porticoccaceae bacterium]
MIVIWRVTEHCNLACGFCAYDRRLAGARRQVDRNVVCRLGPIFGEYLRATGERLLLSWIGGEPLLWPDVYQTSTWLHQEYGVEISATTNGSTLHLPQVVRSIVDSFSELTVSVDGLSRFHDQVRGCPGGWQRLQTSVRALAQARTAAGSRLKIRSNTVLMRDNLAEFTALCGELAEWGVDEITFNQLGGRDRPEFFPEHGLRPQDVDELRNLLPGLSASLAARGVRLCASARYLMRIEASALRHPLPVENCQPGERLLFIDEAGRVSPCSFTADQYGVALHDLRDSADLRELPLRYRSARANVKSASCSDCPSNQVFAKFSA